MTIYRSDWKIERLGDFALHEKGSKPKRSQKNADDVFTYPYVDIQAFEKGIVKEYTDGQKCVLCEENDFLMVWDGSRSGYVGKAIIGALGSTLMKISFPGIETDYAYFFLQSKYLEINSRAKGTGTPHVDPGILWNYQFAIPPLPEQRAIVAKIEQLFSELGNGIACLKKAQEQLKIYRQAVLKQAFEGELTKVWREQQTDLPSSQDLLNTIKAERERAAKNHGKKLKPVTPLSQDELDDLPELPEGWIWVKISQIANVSTGVTPLKKRNDYYCDGSIPWITSSAVNNLFVEKPSAYVTEIALKETGLKIYPKNTLLVAMYGEGKTRGKCSQLLIDATSNQAIAAIIQNGTEEFIRPCLKYYLVNNYWEIRRKSSGGVQPNLNLGIIENTIFPLAPLREQAQIVQEIETRLSVCDNMEAT
ncbi:MAG: hypothetical protein HGA81_03390, partial [Chlorobium limicola]|nr:hypothetical protein [Chlorobium limicola]